MKTSEKGISLIHGFEGLADKRPDGMIYPYLDQVGVATIGYGSTFYLNGTRVKINDAPITQEDANKLFLNVLSGFENAVTKFVTSNINKNQFDSLVSFSYNLGTGALSQSTLLKKVNVNPNDPSIRDEFMKWVNGMIDGKLAPLPGLVARRKAEADHYFEAV